MAIWEHFPYTNFHNINLDWILGKIGAVDAAEKNSENSAKLAEQKAIIAENAAERAVNAAERAENAARISAIGRRFVCIGDSYGTGYSPNGVNDGFFSKAKNYLGLSDYAMRIQCVGGAGFAFTGSQGYNFENLLATCNDVEDPLTVSDIVVIGGYNDRYATSGNIKTAISSFIARAKNMFPNATVSIGFCGRSVEVDDALSINESLRKVQGAYHESVNWAVIPNMQYALQNLNHMSSDGFHPNNIGQECLAQLFVSWVLRGAVDYVESNVVSETATLATRFVQTIHNNTIMVSTVPVSHDVTVDGSLSGAVAIDLGIISGGFMAGCAYDSPVGDVFVMVRNSGVYHLGRATVRVDSNRHVTLTPFVLNSDGSNWLNGCDRIQLLTSTFTLESDWV